MRDKFEAAHAVLSGTNEVINEIKDDKNAMMLLKMAPYLEALNIPIPKVPDVTGILKDALSSLMPDFNILNKNAKLVDSLKEDVKTKAFAVHQILGILQEHEKITLEQCIDYRRNVFKAAISSVSTINDLKNPINKADESIEKIKGFVKDLVETLVGDEVKNEIKKQINAKDEKESETEEKQKTEEKEAKKQKEQESKEKKQTEKAEDDFWYNFKKMGKEVIQIGADVISTAKAATTLYQITGSLTTGKFDDSKFDSYSSNVDEYLVDNAEIQHLKQLTHSRVAREQEVNNRIEKVAHNDLGEGFLNKFISYCGKKLNQVDDYAQVVATFMLYHLGQIKDKITLKHQEIDKIIDDLNERDHYNIKELEEYLKKVASLHPEGLFDEIEALRQEAKKAGCHYIPFYEGLDAQKAKVKEVIVRQQELAQDLEAGTQNLKNLKTDIDEYIVDKNSSIFGALREHFINYEPESGKSTAVKVSAARHLKDRIQEGKVNYEVNGSAALSHGDLSKKMDAFLNYKASFQESIKHIEEAPVTPTNKLGF